MANDNTIKIILIALAVLVLFNGGLTGESIRKNFSYLPMEDNQGEVCSPHKYGQILAGGQSAIFEVYSDCSEKIVEYCQSYHVTSKPFRVSSSYDGHAVIECANKRVASTKPPMVIDGVQ